MICLLQSVRTAFVIASRVLVAFLASANAVIVQVW